MYNKPAYWLIVMWEGEEVVDRCQVVDESLMADTIYEMVKKSMLRKNAHLCSVTIQRKNFADIAENCESCRETCEAACTTCNKREVATV